MVLKRTTLLLLAGCAGGDRALVEAPTRLRLAAPPPYVLGDTTVEVQRAALSVADALLRGPDGDVVGDWPHADVVELVGGPEDVDPLRVYEGEVAGGDFGLGGAPALDLRGVVVTAEGALVPFDLTPTLQLRPSLVVDLPAVEAGAVPEVDWVLDLAVVLGPIEGTPSGDGEPLRAEGATLEQLTEGLLAPGAWRLEARGDALP